MKPVKNGLLLLLVVSLLGAISSNATAGSKGYQKDPTEVKEIPVNKWVKIYEGKLGQYKYALCRGPALLYVPPLDRFLTAMGALSRADRATPVYSETTLSLDEQEWVNWYPKGKDWGPRVGAAKDAPWIGGSGLKKGPEGVLRPHLRSSYGMPVWHQYCWDSDRGRAIFFASGNLIEYDPVKREWYKPDISNSPLQNELDLDVRNNTKFEWGALGYDPINKEVLLFGGASAMTERGDLGTWVYSIKDQKWRKLDPGSKQMKQLHDAAMKLKGDAQAMLTGCRNRYYRTERTRDEGRRLQDILQERLNPAHIDKLLTVVKSWGPKFGGHERTQAGWAHDELDEALDTYKTLLSSLGSGVDEEKIKTARKVRALLRRASISLASQPPQRCYSPMVFDPNSQKIVLFGGNHLDRALADTWLYDPKTRTWEERRPEVGPSPRHNHGMLYLPKAKKVALVGGWQNRADGDKEKVVPLPGEAWTYDVENNRWELIQRWKRGKAFGGLRFQGPHVNSVTYAVDANDTVVIQRPEGRTWACSLNVNQGEDLSEEKYGVPPKTEQFISRTGEKPSPEWYDSAPAPEPEKFQKKLDNLPVNTWVRLDAGGRTHQFFAYSTIAYDSGRGQILVWAGGHSTTHFTTVARYSLTTSRWQVDFPPQIPQNYGRNGWGSNYAYGYRPWMPRHPWDAYDYDPPSGRLVLLQTSGPLTLTFNPDTGDFEKPQIPRPKGGDKLVTMGSTPDGVVMWTNGRRLLRLDWNKKKWVELPVVKGKVPESHYYDGVTYDSKRNQIVLVNNPRYSDNKHIEIYTYDLETKHIIRKDPPNKKEAAGGFAREFVYVPDEDIHMGSSGHYWDPKANRWGKLSIKQAKQIKMGANSGMIYDPKRKLFWAIEGYDRSGPYVMKLDFDKAK